MKIIEGNLDLDRLHLKELPEILSKVDKIDGYFSVSDNRISSLKNCPRIIGESVYFSYNEKLKNLVGGPEIVGKNYGVSGCKELISLQGIPKIIPGNLQISSNYKLIDFTYFPKKIGGDLEVGHYLGGTRKFPKEFTVDFFRSICDIGGKVKIYRWMDFL
jgi:hypothetical protein